MRTLFRQVLKNTQGPWDWIVLVSLVLLLLTLLASIPVWITGVKLSGPAVAASLVTWAYITVVFTLKDGYELYNDFRAKKFPFVPGRRLALAYRLFDAAIIPAAFWLILFTGGMLTPRW